MERWVRYILVTPDMHRIHYLSIVDETNSNFGFSISLRDRLYGSYRETPKRNNLEMEIGLKKDRQQEDLRFTSLIFLPFQETMGHYSYQKDRG